MKKTLFLLFFILSIFFVPTKIHALGVSPGTTELKNIPQNASITRYITISRANPSTDQKASITISGAAGSYVTLPSGGVVSLPKGQQQTQFPILISTKKLAAGTYEAAATIAMLPESSSAGMSTTGSSVLAGVKVKIFFSVTTDAIEDYSINKVHIQPTEEGRLIGFDYELYNQGAVDSRPTKIEFSIVNDETQANVYTETIDGSELALVPALSNKRVDVLTKASLPVGKYKATFIFYNKDQKIFSNTAPFQVFPPGTLAQGGSLITLTSDKQTYDSGESVKFNASFQNTGTVGLTAALIIEVYQGGKRIDLIKTADAFIPLKQTANLETYYKPTKGGAFIARGHVAFGPLTSNEIEIHFSVKELNAIILISSIVVLILFIFGAAFFIKMRKKNSVNSNTRLKN